MGSEHVAACNQVALNQGAIGLLHELDCVQHEFQAWENALYRALVSEDPEGSIDLLAANSTGRNRVCIWDMATPRP